MHTSLQVIWDQQPRNRTPEFEHPDMCADPVRQSLRPACLGIGQVGRTRYPDKGLRVAYFAAVRIEDRYFLAGIINESFVAGEVALPRASPGAP